MALTQKELADLCIISKAAIVAYESGRRKPCAEVRRTMNEKMGIPLEALAAIRLNYKPTKRIPKQTI